ncbi:MAG: hypothetical protein ACI92S_000229 [Planctomycetaceae bacterium]|jgi:hypothetical protein
MESSSGTSNHQKYETYEVIFVYLVSFVVVPASSGCDRTSLGAD